MSNIQDMATLMRILQDHPDWVDTVQSLIAQDGNADTQRRPETTGTTKELLQSDPDICELISRKLEEIRDQGDPDRRYELAITAEITVIARELMDMRKTRVLKSPVTGTTQEWQDLIEGAQDKKYLTREEADDLFKPRIVLIGESYHGGPNTYAKIEIARTIGECDVRKAIQRATTFRNATELSTRPTVIGARIHGSPVRRLADGGSVLLALVAE